VYPVAGHPPSCTVTSPDELNDPALVADSLVSEDAVAVAVDVEIEEDPPVDEGLLDVSPEDGAVVSEPADDSLVSDGEDDSPVSEGEDDSPVSDGEEDSPVSESDEDGTDVSPPDVGWLVTPDGSVADDARELPDPDAMTEPLDVAVVDPSSDAELTPEEPSPEPVEAFSPASLPDPLDDGAPFDALHPAAPARISARGSKARVARIMGSSEGQGGKEAATIAAELSSVEGMAL
jgi:hypothetical protein